MSDYKQTGDLIRREDAIHILACVLYAEASLRGEDAKMEDYIPEATAWMSDAPSADRPTGEWEVVDATEPRRYGCSKCKRLSWDMSNYCPNCGAKMEGGEEE